MLGFIILAAKISTMNLHSPASKQWTRLWRQKRPSMIVKDGASELRCLRGDPFTRCLVGCHRSDSTDYSPDVVRSVLRGGLYHQLWVGRIC